MYGTRRCTIDAKVRVTIPSDIRKSLLDADKRVVLVPFKDECLYGFTPAKFEEWVEGIFASNGRSYDDRKPADRKLMRRLRGSAVELTLDAAGRLALGKLDAVDESLRPGKTPRRILLGLEHDVMVVGNGDRFEIWDADRWLADQEEADEDFFALFDVE